MRKANALIRAYSESDPNLYFLGVFSQFLDRTGRPRPELYIQDQLHLKPDGYKIWVAALRPLLAEIVRSDGDRVLHSAEYVDLPR
jgi:lysophospholipase L1-like esterase